MLQKTEIPNKETSQLFDNSHELMTVEEVAGFLRIHPQTVYAKLRTGEIPYLRVFGQIRFERSEVLQKFRRTKNVNSQKR